MSLLPGARLGPYEIVEPIGAGGMGQVYCARDVKLQRDVAVKILPELFAADPDRLARFEREAQVLASLNHQNIAQVYGIVEGPPTAIVMEFVEGEDLGERLARGALPLDAALPIARALALALEAAHERGVIHRDLKPGNIRIRPDGTVKVLDFGLAKAFDAAAAGSTTDTKLRAAQNSPTFTSPAMTQMGVILGTAAYMAPEQAKGGPVDKRVDIWAFGVVVFELLTARQLYAADTVAETIARVIEREPNLSMLPARTPGWLRTLLVRCLERDPRQRLRDIGEARIVLERSSAASGGAAVAAFSSKRRLLVWPAAAVLLAIGAVAAFTWAGREPAAGPLRKLAVIPPGEGLPFTAAISPDGAVVALIVDDRIWLQNLDRFDAAELPGTSGAHAVFWSPDGRSLGFQARGQLWRLAREGGQPVAIGRVPQEFTAAGGAAWLDDSRIIFTTGGSGLLEIPVQGGEATTALETDAAQEADLHDVAALPGGRGVVFVSHPLPAAARGWRIDVFTPHDGTRQRVFDATGSILNPSYAPSGHLLFQQGSGVWALPFSLSRLRATGEPFLVASNARDPSAAADGTLVTLAGGGTGSELRLTWVDLSGKADAPLAYSMPSAHHPVLSPDGRYVAVADALEGDSDIWILDLARGADRRLTFESGRDAYPVWTADGQSIIYECESAGAPAQPTICARPADGSGARVELLKGPAGDPELSPDARFLVFVHNNDLWIVEVGESGLTAPLTAEPKPFVAAERAQRGPRISPDGRFAAYESTEAGVWTVYVTRFPSGEGKWELFRGFAQAPRWSPRGDRIHVVDDLRRIAQIDLDLSTTFSAGPPSVRIAAEVSWASGFDLSRDGTRFLVPRPAIEPGRPNAILITQNWFQEFREGRQ